MLLRLLALLIWIGSRRHLAAEQIGKNLADGVQVHGKGGRAAALLRWAPPESSSSCCLAALDSRPKVDDDQLPVVAPAGPLDFLVQDIAWLQVAVHNVPLVQIGQKIGEIGSDFKRVADRQRLADAVDLVGGHQRPVVDRKKPRKQLPA